MKITTNQTPYQNKTHQTNFKGIVCPNKYAKLFYESIEEFDQITNKNILENKPKIIQFLKSIFKNSSKKKQYKTEIHNSFFMQDPSPKKRVLMIEDPKTGEMVETRPYDYIKHIIYKKNNDGLITADIDLEKEKSIFDIFKKKVIEANNIKNGDQMTNEELLKNFGIAFFNKNLFKKSGITLLDKNDIEIAQKIRSYDSHIN